MMSMTECYQVSDVTLPQEKRFQLTPGIIDNFHFIFLSTFSPLNAFFYMRNIFDCSFSSGNNNKNKGTSSPSLGFSSLPLLSIIFSPC
jgi:hypothetical protein